MSASIYLVSYINILYNIKFTMFLDHGSFGLNVCWPGPGKLISTGRQQIPNGLVNGPIKYQGEMKNLGGRREYPRYHHGGRHYLHLSVKFSRDGFIGETTNVST